MNSAQQTRFEPNAVPHPGETVLEYLDFFGWSQRDLARRTGLAPKTISEICSGKAPITPQTALVFEKAFQRPAHLFALAHFRGLRGRATYSHRPWHGPDRWHHPIQWNTAYHHSGSS